MKTRELVYRGLGGDRPRLHLLAGQILEEAARLRPDETLEEVAYHFLQGGAREMGLHYAERAGDKCARLYAYAPALEFLQKALGLLPRNESRRRMEIFSKIARIHIQSANYAEMQDFLNRGLRIARALQDRSREGHFIASIAYGHLLQGHFELAVRNARLALSLFEPLGDHLGMGRAKNLIATAYRAQPSKTGKCLDILPHCRHYHVAHGLQLPYVDLPDRIDPCGAVVVHLRSLLERLVQYLV